VRHTFFVPVRASRAGTLALKTGRLRSGEEVGLAFTSQASLLLTLGPSQESIQLGGQALQAMLLPLGVEQVRVDPRPVGELEMAASPQQPAPLHRARPPRSASREAGPGCPSGHYRSVVARLASRHHAPASGLAATRRRGAVALDGGQGRE
jgi:hypothetical protein